MCKVCSPIPTFTFKDCLPIITERASTCSDDGVSTLFDNGASTFSDDGAFTRSDDGVSTLFDVYLF